MIISVGNLWCLTPNFWTFGLVWIIFEEGSLRWLASRDCYSCLNNPPPIFISQHIRTCSLGTITRDIWIILSNHVPWALYSCNSTSCTNPNVDRYVSLAYLLPIMSLEELSGNLDRGLAVSKTTSGNQRCGLVIFEEGSLRWLASQLLGILAKLLINEDHQIPAGKTTSLKLLIEDSSDQRGLRLGSVAE